MKKLALGLVLLASLSMASVEQSNRQLTSIEQAQLALKDVTALETIIDEIKSRYQRLNNSLVMVINERDQEIKELKKQIGDKVEKTN